MMRALPELNVAVQIVLYSEERTVVEWNQGTATTVSTETATRSPVGSLPTTR